MMSDSAGSAPSSATSAAVVLFVFWAADWALHHVTDVAFASNLLDMIE